MARRVHAGARRTAEIHRTVGLICVLYAYYQLHCLVRISLHDVPCTQKTINVSHVIVFAINVPPIHSNKVILARLLLNNNNSNDNIHQHKHHTPPPAPPPPLPTSTSTTTTTIIFDIYKVEVWRNHRHPQTTLSSQSSPCYTVSEASRHRSQGGPGPPHCLYRRGPMNYL